MINLIDKKFINATDLHSFIESKTGYYNWLARCINYADLKENTDYYIKEYKTKTKSGKIYLFTIQAAKEICLVSSTDKAKELRRWLIGISESVEKGETLHGSDFLKLLKVVKIFAIYEERKKAYDKNMKNFIANFHEQGKPVNYTIGKFQKIRNEILNLGKDELNKRVLEYCILERRKMPDFNNKDEMLVFLNEYEQIKVAVWDLLSSKNKSDEYILNIAKLAQQIAIEIKPFLYQFNENNLFQKKIEQSDINNVLENL